MLRTSSQEGGLQERTESPKATSGASNGFVRPVAVANIFRPALGSSGVVSGVDSKSAAPEKRRSVVAKENKSFCSSLSNEEFSRRRQSFDTKTTITFSQNALKQISENRVSTSEYVPQQDNEVSTSDEKCDENAEGRKSRGEIQNAVGKKLKDDKGDLSKTSIVVKSSGTAEKETLNREEKEKNSKNTSHVKSEKSNKVPPLLCGSDLIKVAPSNENNDPVIQNGITEGTEVTAVETRSRSRTAGAREYLQTPAAPQTERRCRNKISVSTCVDKESAPSALGTTKTESVAKDSAISSRGEEVIGIKSDRIFSKAVSGNQNVTVTECIPQPVTVLSERLGGDQTSQDTCFEKNCNLGDAKVVQKALSSQKSCEADFILLLKGSSTTQTKCGSQINTDKPDVFLRSNGEKRDSIEALDTQAGSKFRTCRRTSDVIAAKIQTIFSKSDKPLTQPSQNKLSSSRSKLGASVTEREPKLEICVAKNEENSSGNSLNAAISTVLLSCNDNDLNKSDSANSKKLQNVKCLQKFEASSNTESRLKHVNKTPLETASSIVNGDITHSTLNNKKSVVRNHVKDTKFNSNQKLYDSALSVPVQSTVCTDSEKKTEVAPPRSENAITTQTEISPTAKELTSDPLLIKEEKTSSAVKKPVASINFLITEVSVENSTLPLKINTRKVQPLRVRNKQPSQSAEEKNCDTQKYGTKKCTNDDSKVNNFAPESSVVNSEVLISRCSDKYKVGKAFLLKEESKVSSANQQKESSQIQKYVAEEKISSSTKALNTVKSDLVNSGSVILKSPEKGKISKALPLEKENKVESENLLQKCSQVQKSSAGKNISCDTKTQSCTSSQLVNSTSQVLKSLEKDKIGGSLPLKESTKVPYESLPPKASQKQKSNTEGNISGVTKVQSSTGGETINFGTLPLKPPEKDKAGKAVPLKEGNKVEFKNLPQNSSEVQKSDLSTAQVLKTSSEKDKVGRSLPPNFGTKVLPENLLQKTSQIKKSGAGINISFDTKSQSSVCSEFVNSKTEVLKASETNKTDKASLPLKEDKVLTEGLQQKSNQVQKLCPKESTVCDLKVQSSTDSEIVNSGPRVLKQSEKGAEIQGLLVRENKVVSRSLNKKSSIFQKWGAKENASGALKVKSVCTDDVMPPKPSSNTSKTLQKNESAMPSENVKQKFGAVQKLGAKEPVPGYSIENTTSNTESVNSCDSSFGSEQHVDGKTKSFNSIEAVCNSEKISTEDKVFSKVKKIVKPEQKLDEVANYVVVKKVTSAVKKVTPPVPVVEYSQAESIASAAKSVQPGKVLETAQIVLSSQSPTTKRSEKQESREGIVKQAKYSSMQSQDSPEPKVGTAQKELSVDSTNDKFSVDQGTLKTSVSNQVEVVSTSNGKQADAVLTNSVTLMEGTSKSKNSGVGVPVVQHLMKDSEDLFMSAKCTVREPSAVLLESSCYRSKESQKFSKEMSLREKGCDDSGALISTDMSLIKGNNSALNTEFSGRSSSLSKLEIPRPPERKRSGFLREMSSLMSSPPPRVPLRSMSRTGSLKYPDDSRLSILRSSSQSILSSSYTPQRISYTEMLSKLGTCGLNPPLTASNRKFGTSQVSELWTDLGEEQSNSAHMSEMLESETSERMRLEKEVQELQSRYSHVQQKSDKMEMEMMEARVYRATEVNGDLSEDEENDATVSIYKQKYGRAVRDMEIMKRRLQQQHEEEMEQSLMLKKASDKRLTEALEDVEEERQVVNQWKRKAQKLGAELQDLRLMLEEQMARNGELEKKQRRFDAELSSAQEEIRKEHQLREKLTRERDQAQLEKYSLEQELQATRLDMDMQHEKIAVLNRELDELSLSSKGEEEVTQLKRAKQELERKARDQEEELEELAGQVQMLEQSKLRLEMSLEKLRQEHRRESSVRDEEIEEIRASSSKKIKNLEAQLENEQEERHQLVKQKHELERRIIELSDQPPPQDPEIERRLRRDLKRTKALLKDAQSMLEHMRDGQANKTLIRQLKNQLEDAEFTKSVAIKARQTAELELQELQSQLEEVTRTKNDIESRCLQLSREKSALQTQLEEMEEEMAEIMKKYKAAVAQMSIDQKSLAEQIQQISELESEKLNLKEQLSEVSSKLDHVSGQTEDSARVHRLDAKVRDLESKLELEQTTRSRLEHQITRLKEQCDRSREECDSLRSKELQSQEGTRRFQRQLRELREDYAALQQKESEAYRKQHELEMALENTEADLQVTKNDLRLACQRIQDLQNALEDDLDSGTDVPDDSGSESDSSLDVSVLGRQCLTPLQRSDSISSNTSLGSDGRQFRALSHSQDMAYFSRMMQRRTSMDFLI